MQFRNLFISKDNQIAFTIEIDCMAGEYSCQFNMFSQRQFQELPIGDAA